MRAAYLFEAKGVQRWVMEGGRLRYIAAASDLLANVATSDGNDVLGEVLAESGLAERIDKTGVGFSRRASGAFMLHYDRDTDHEAFEHFRNLWRLVFMQVAPGLEFVESFGLGDNDVAARKMAYEAPIRSSAGRENGFTSLLPLGHPLVAWAQHTGRPAVDSENDDRIDAVTQSKRRFGNLEIAGVGARFMPAGADPRIEWPAEMEIEPQRIGETDADYKVRMQWRGPRFPFIGDSRWIGVVHADISALGVFYRNVGDRKMPSDAKTREFAFGASRAIEDALETAARAASAAFLLPNIGHDDEKKVDVMPARPILLGGDDVTIIVRGDLALPWTEKFLEQLEIVSDEALKQFADNQGLSDEQRLGIVAKLTACAGIAFGKSKQPFFRLLNLADGLCGFAKWAAKELANGGNPVPSMLAFHRVTESALAAEANDLFAALEKDGRRLSAQPYRIGGIEAHGYATLGNLRSVKETLEEGSDAFKRGPLREMRKQLLDGGLGDVARETWSRWQQMAKSRGGDVEAFNAALAQAAGDASLLADLPFGAGCRSSVTDKDGDVHVSALFDAIEWEAVS